MRKPINKADAWLSINMREDPWFKWRKGWKRQSRRLKRRVLRAELRRLLHA